MKCPYCVCDGELYSAPYIQGDGALSKTHAYYYQVQTQLLVCSANYADFVVITFSSKNVTFQCKEYQRMKSLSKIRVLLCLLNGQQFHRPHHKAYT